MKHKMSVSNSVSQPVNTFACMSNEKLKSEKNMFEIVNRRCKANLMNKLKKTKYIFRFSNHLFFSESTNQTQLSV